ncbi:MAG TPA: M57 family metalloprotease [Ferruginibacter sp.]|nr:M57 family metalloprotease [Ferruginibacter sp.]
MKQMLKLLSFLMVVGILFASCKKDASNPQEEIPQATLLKIYEHGFGTFNVQKIEEGYLVEGDIILTEAFLNERPGGNFLRIANNEQYRTTNLVTAPRAIKLALDSKLAAKAGYPQALAVVRDRYNAQNLTLTFSIVSSGADITFVEGHGSYLASAGFPTGGRPYGSVKVNAQSIGTGNTSTFYNFLGTIMAHEAGHCIGFRHTDYMDRSYSCGGSYANEGASNVGAIYIPGTATGPDPKSWMLACISRNESRPFNANDRTALAYLY